MAPFGICLHTDELVDGLWEVYKHAPSKMWELTRDFSLSLEVACPRKAQCQEKKNLEASTLYSSCG